MDIKEALLKEHTKDQCVVIVNHIGKNTDRFSQLVAVFLRGPYRLTQRAAWPLSVCCEKEPHLIRPHLNKILNKLGQADLQVAVKRNVVRLLQFIPIPKHLQGKTVDICFQFLQNNMEPIAVRVFAMTVLANLAKALPELKNDLIPLVEDHLPYASTGFTSRGRKVLKELKT